MENPQAPQEMTPDEAKASLGVATTLQDQLLQSNHSQEQAQTPQDQGGNGEKPKPEQKPKEGDVKEVKAEMELEMNKKLDEIRKELKEDHQRDIDMIKEQITSALAEEDNNEPSETEKPA